MVYIYMLEIRPTAKNLKTVEIVLLFRKAKGKYKYVAAKKWY